MIVITSYFLTPYILDLPKLIKGEFEYVTGYPYEVNKYQKSLYESYSINGKRINFLFISDIEEYKHYKIGYLPNTSRGIKLIDFNKKDSSENKEVGFPYKSIFFYILFFILFFIVIVILTVLSPYLKLKLLLVSCILFYSTNTYLYFKYSINTGAWFSWSNKPLVYLILGVVSLVMLLLVELFGNRFDRNNNPNTLFIQIVGLVKLISVIYIFTKIKF